MPRLCAQQVCTTSSIPLDFLVKKAHESSVYSKIRVTYIEFGKISRKMFVILKIMTTFAQNIIHLCEKKADR